MDFVFHMLKLTSAESVTSSWFSYLKYISQLTLGIENQTKTVNAENVKYKQKMLEMFQLTSTCGENRR